MKLLVATDAHLYRTRDGAYYCNALYGYDYFTRYFAAFDAVRVVAREEPIASVPENWLRVDGGGRRGVWHSFIPRTKTVAALVLPDP